MAIILKNHLNRKDARNARKKKRVSPIIIFTMEVEFRIFCIFREFSISFVKYFAIFASLQ